MMFARCMVSSFVGVVLCGLLSANTVSAEERPELEAVRLLKGLENFRTVFKPFKVNGTATRLVPGINDKRKFRVDCEGQQYRITTLGSSRGVAICDGNRLLTYDGDVSATISSLDRREANVLAFDPRTLGVSTGLYSDLTLKKNLAYHSGNDIVIAEIPANRRQPALVGIELTDSFHQRIRFELESRAPHRVRYYSKTVFGDDGQEIYKYVTESEYWAEQPESWIPKKLTMYTIYDGRDDKRMDDMLVELERPELVPAFEPGTWSFSGLSLPFGQPVVDLRIKQRIGYWNGITLVGDLPTLKVKSKQ